MKAIDERCGVTSSRTGPPTAHRLKGSARVNVDEMSVVLTELENLGAVNVTDSGGERGGHQLSSFREPLRRRRRRALDRLRHRARLDDRFGGGDVRPGCACIARRY